MHAPCTEEYRGKRKMATSKHVMEEEKNFECDIDEDISISTDIFCSDTSDEEIIFDSCEIREEGGQVLESIPNIIFVDESTNIGVVVEDSKMKSNKKHRHKIPRKSNSFLYIF